MADLILTKQQKSDIFDKIQNKPRDYLKCFDVASNGRVRRTINIFKEIEFQTKRIEDRHPENVATKRKQSGYSWYTKALKVTHTDLLKLSKEIRKNLDVDNLRAQFLTDPATKLEIERKTLAYTKPSKTKIVKESDNMWVEYVDEERIDVTVNKKDLFRLLRDNPGLIAGMDNVPEELQLACVNNPENLEYIKNPTEATQIKSVSRTSNSNRILDIPNPSMAVQEAAVKGNHTALQFLEQTENLQIIAIEKSKTAIRLIRGASKRVRGAYKMLYEL